MTSETQFISAVPVLASSDISESVEFFCNQFGFTSVQVKPGAYGIVTNGPVQIHFWAFADETFAEHTSCRIRVDGIDALYKRCDAAGIVHPSAPLETKPWGSKEFAILDPDDNVIVFNEWSKE